jgi:hypothetical protein
MGPTAGLEMVSKREIPRIFLPSTQLVLVISHSTGAKQGDQQSGIATNIRETDR